MRRSLPGRAQPDDKPCRPLRQTCPCRDLATVRAKPPLATIQTAPLGHTDPRRVRVEATIHTHPRRQSISSLDDHPHHSTRQSAPDPSRVDVPRPPGRQTAPRLPDVPSLVIPDSPHHARPSGRFNPYRQPSPAPSAADYPFPTTPPRLSLPSPPDNPDRYGHITPDPARHTAPTLAAHDKPSRPNSRPDIPCLTDSPAHTTNQPIPCLVDDPCLASGQPLPNRAARTHLSRPLQTGQAKS